MVSFLQFCSHYDLDNTNKLAVIDYEEYQANLDILNRFSNLDNHSGNDLFSFDENLS